MSAKILIVVSLDTKAAEARHLLEQLRAAGQEAEIADFSILGALPFTPDIPAEAIAAAAGTSLAALRGTGARNAALAAMARGIAAIAADRHRRGLLSGVLGLGGSGGTSVGTAAMRALPLGVPKLMISTVASGDVRPFVDVADIVMVHSVVDFAGLNPISRAVLGNAAGAMAGMVARRNAAPPGGADAPLIAASMFGVTTPAVEKARILLEAEGYVLVPFHATGIGGRTMEGLIAEGWFAGVLDLTTTEWADEVVGGTLSAGPNRLDAAGRAGIPQVVGPGALDMVNFWGGAGVPERFAGRLIHQHGENSYLMRTTAPENGEIGRRIAGKLNAATGPVSVLFPTGGFSTLDRPGGPFADPGADAALLEALRTHLAPRVGLEIVDAHINDDAFAAAAVTTLLRHLPRSKEAARHA